ncbi:MAG: Uracil-DNA glycosylase, putative family 6 [Actinobacteria bacterium]|nr:Uracil-DNA glycosylase, putative family 6 [Actinomycetota bacterium]
MTTGPQDLIHPDDTLADLAAAVQDCRGCGLWSDATQAVFGEGPPKAPVMLVGEQPGDVEDRRGHPFVGPAGLMLRSCMAEAGLAEDQVWMTNVVKHFRWKLGTQRQGKRRIHHTPAAEHIHACRPWLDAELERLRPDVLVCLGAVAAQTLIDKDFKVSQDRGRLMPGPYGNVLATVHPSSLLRAPDGKARLKARADFVADLQVVVRHLAGHARAASA